MRINVSCSDFIFWSWNFKKGKWKEKNFVFILFFLVNFCKRKFEKLYKLNKLHKDSEYFFTYLAKPNTPFTSTLSQLKKLIFFIRIIPKKIIYLIYFYVINIYIWQPTPQYSKTNFFLFGTHECDPKTIGILKSASMTNILKC